MNLSRSLSARASGGYSLVACVTAELVLTATFLMIILGATDRRAPAGMAPVAIGLGLTLIHLVGIPVTNLSVNPTRSLATAVFVGDWALQQVWLFWAVPIAGAFIAGKAYSWLAAEERTELRAMTRDDDATETREAA